MTTNMLGTSDRKNEEDAWNDICVNPHGSFMEEGRRDGRERGLEAGYKEGYSLGRTKAWEIGIELGFIQGFIVTVRSELHLLSKEDGGVENAKTKDRTNSSNCAVGDRYEEEQMIAATSDPIFSSPKLEKIQKGLDSLEAAIRIFPDAHAMFTSSSPSLPPTTNALELQADEEDDGQQKQNNNNDEKIESIIDPSLMLQRIRAKFKLVKIHLQIQHLSVESAMADAKKDAKDLLLSSSLSSDKKAAVGHDVLSSSDW